MANLIFVYNRRGKVCSHHISISAVYFIGKRMFIDLTGQKFGKLTVTGKANSNGHHTRWNCKCDCGNECTIYATNLTRGNSKSCGCLALEKVSTHKKSNTRLYRVWAGIKRRCYNKQVTAYANYGGRGITMCDEWKNDFQAFYNWAMSTGYDENAPYGQYTIDRIDVNGNYEPSNCRWATLTEQTQNTRNNLVITHNGETKTVPQWAKIYGINKKTIYTRIYSYGWDKEKAIITPIKHKEQ